MATDREIEELKSAFRARVLHYRKMLEGRDYGCGLNMTAYINPSVAIAARAANEAAEALKAVDPAFPASWTPYPEGD